MLGAACATPFIQYCGRVILVFIAAIGELFYIVGSFHKIPTSQFPEKNRNYVISYNTKCIFHSREKSDKFIASYP